MKDTKKEKIGRGGGVRALADTLGTDTAVLRGEHGAVVYGCRRILYYSPARICLSLGKRQIAVTGKDLICTSFCAGSVTVAGSVEGIAYCRARCEKCPREEGEG